MSSDVQLRAAALEKVMQLHQDLLWNCVVRWGQWRPNDYLAELRRLRAQHNPDATVRLRVPTLDDPTFFFWSIFNTQDAVFPEFTKDPSISIRRIIGIRNAAAHGDDVDPAALAFIDQCGKKMHDLLEAANQATPQPPTAAPPVAPAGQSVFPPAPIISAVDFANRTQVLAFYVVCDKSASMAGDAIETVNNSLVEMQRVLLSDPVITDKCWMSIISFSSQAHVELELCSPPEIQALPTIEAGGITNYGAAFSLLKNQIEVDLPSLAQSHRPLRPVVFFLTDGAPSDEHWHRDLQLLVDASETYAPTLVVLPVGDIPPSVLSEFQNVPDGITPQVQEIGAHLALEVAVRQAIQSITNSVITTIRSDSDDFEFTR
jgi:uncharacterized protein YegL